MRKHVASYLMCSVVWPGKNFGGECTFQCPSLRFITSSFAVFEDFTDPLRWCLEAGIPSHFWWLYTAKGPQGQASLCWDPWPVFCPVNFGSVFSQQGKVIMLSSLSGVSFPKRLLLYSWIKIPFDIFQAKKHCGLLFWLASTPPPSNLSVWKMFVKMKSLLVEPGFVMTTAPSCIWGTACQEVQDTLRAWFLLAS